MPNLSTPRQKGRIVHKMHYFYYIKLSWKEQNKLSENSITLESLFLSPLFKSFRNKQVSKLDGHVAVIESRVQQKRVYVFVMYPSTASRLRRHWYVSNTRESVSTKPILHRPIDLYQFYFGAIKTFWDLTWILWKCKLVSCSRLLQNSREIFQKKLIVINLLWLLNSLPPLV